MEQSLVARARHLRKNSTDTDQHLWYFLRAKRLNGYTRCDYIHETLSTRGRHNMLTYKGYIGHVNFDDEAEIFHGDVINTRDVITFQGKTVAELKKAFRESIDDYLSFCKERNEEPDKPFSGKFNLRLDPELHRQVYITARQHQMSLNQWVTEAIKHHIQE